ncbi:Thiamine biosynthesis lipoprotein ApbE precursor [Delftia tsuruhatensis]|uniref:FAD:protein FMN transferase n=1 Tax=Delftia tsuruhatensis TaxID=180282 RepID=UPI001E74682F|nr:FAD:protein FMN transferase [Delftia tsuruhatensis]CAB5659287.1 Thiamine biosynthesis lipoprotein ApbE precursor [Delftia tsuruhatensis]CAC9679618.1 Thiamine biosynthesis lipoprotein ApbE precursor [Delftia tsuruhatensis]
MRVRFAPALLQGGAGRGPVAPAPAGGAASFASGGYGAGVLRRADPAALQTLAGEAMGTTWSVRLHNPGFLPLDAARQAIEDALALVVRQMSNWEEDSDLSRFNRAEAGSWHVLPPEFFAVLTCACDWASASGGAWDPTVGPLVDLWGFGPRARQEHVAEIPDAQALRRARERVGWQRIALDRPRGRALQPGAVHVDFSGIAKGYAVDLVAERLAALGHADFLVEVGGELRARGRRPGGQAWRVAVAGMADQGVPMTLALKDMAIATSGDHWHAFEQGGRRYSHTIDPRSGEPVAHALASVTVLHAECMQADALATVLTVLGPRQGLDFAEQRGVAALLCERTPQGPAVAMTSAFAAQMP